MTTLKVQTHIEELNSLYRKRENYATDAGIDLYTPIEYVVPAKSQIKIDFEISCEMIHEHQSLSYWLLPRSSICKTPLRLSNSMGLIDQSYRGHICAFVDNISDKDYVIEQHTRLFQIAGPQLQPLSLVLGSSFDTTFLSSTLRGENGFGSTGTK
jgi:dUTP pyrophosphatase